ncbi:transcription elongation factor A protein 1-like isoform X2 [Antechinus flavipes]|uniref:transcription elongation factor A protein 1-like isoform X2 n=1 Tax=Antechinus flavipes TaxID=38775 RepID=UPI0022355846|nr:transcription elongation factor A protein 1-like isoform X2 [Antechinus flavipes]
MEDEILRIAKKIDKMVQKKNASTKIGISVNTVRKQSTDEEVTSLAKSLIKCWKKLVREPSKTSTKHKKESAPSCQSSPKPGQESGSSSKENQQKEETNASDSLVKSFPRAPSTLDSVRIKCREMLAAALRTGDDYISTGANVEDLGAQIEEAVYQELRNRHIKYKNRVRSRIANLKDAKNPNLRKNVLCGNIAPDVFARMTAEEMASDELKEIRKNLTKEAIGRHQMALTGGTPSDLFKCGKCKKKNCTYNQLQTLSSDEPMTTYVFCNDCGHRWKFF